MKRIFAALLLALPASPALAVNDGPLTCTEAQRAARQAPDDVPRQYLNQAVSDVCTGRYEVLVVNVPQKTLDYICATDHRLQGMLCIAITSPVGIGDVDQPGCVIFMGPRSDIHTLPHEISHCPSTGWRHTP